MSRKSTQTQDHGFADAHQRELLRLFRLFGHNHNPERVFSDFVELSALAISNSVDRTQFDVREKRYLDIVGKYRKEEVERFAQMLGELTLSFEHRTSGGLGNMNLTDVLGETFMMLECGNASAGQFFTPFSVSKLMALITVGNADGAITENGFTRVQEPACGAGGMVVAMADALGDAGYNFQETMHATCIDIDIRCVHMAYIRLSLLGIPAIVVHGNALSLEVWGVWQTPLHVLGGWNAKLRRGCTLAALERRAVKDVEELIGDAADAAGISLEQASVATCEDRVSDMVACLADLFEVAVAQAREQNIFDKVDQLMLF